MANDTNSSKLHFSLVSPEREIFAGDVDQVVVPAANGEFGALVNHSPMMSVVKAGVIKIINGSDVNKMYVGGGIVDVTNKGVTILAEDAVEIASLDRSKIETELKDAKEDLRDAKDDAHREAAEVKIAKLEIILAA